MDPSGSGGSIVGRIELRPLLSVTTGLVFLTIVLGVATRATGSGLACHANWPLCDGGLLNLLPTSLPSFFEWIHRVVAGIAGLFILASAFVSWRRNASSLVRRTVTLGTVLLPVQVLLGRQTVVAFVPPVLAAHYWTAMVIYGAFVVATIGVFRDALRRRHLLGGLVIALVATPAIVVLAPPIVTSYTPPIQALQYVFVLLGFAGLLLASIVVWPTAESPERYVVALATLLLPLVVFFGRQRIVTPELPLGVVHEVTATVLFLSVATALWLDLRSGRDPSNPVDDR